MDKKSQEYKDALEYAHKLATEAGYPAVIRHWPGTGRYLVELVELENDGPEFEIVQANKAGPGGPERTIS